MKWPQGRDFKALVWNRWSLLFLCWSAFVVGLDTAVRVRRPTPGYLVALVASWLLWSAALEVVARLQGLSLVAARVFAALFSTAVTVADVGALGYYEFYQKDVIGREWQFVLENPTWALVLALDATSWAHVLLLIGAPPAITLVYCYRSSSLVPLGRSPFWSCAVVLAALAMSGAITKLARPLTADVVGLRALAAGTIAGHVRGIDLRTLPAPRRVALPSHMPLNAPDVVLVLHESVGFREALGQDAQMPEAAAFVARHGERVVSFPWAHAVATMTSVSLPTLVSGQEPRAPRDDFARAPLLWHVARANGYSTALFSAQDLRFDFVAPYLLGADQPDVTEFAADYLARGASRVNELGVDDRVAIDAAMDFLDRHSGGRPRFVIIQLNATHWPCWTPSLGPGRWRQIGSSKRAAPDPQRCEAATRFVDEQAARLLKELEGRGRLDRTLIIYTSDHGEVFRPGRPGRHYSFYEDVLRIPLFVSLPNALLDRLAVLKANSRHPSNTLDIYPTLLDVWGGPTGTAAPVLSGQSLLQALPASRVLMSMTDSSISQEARGFALYYRSWKWTFGEQTGGQLFDLDRDPAEERDLAAAPPADLLQILRMEIGRRSYLEAVVRDLAPEVYRQIAGERAASEGRGTESP